MWKINSKFYICMFWSYTYLETGLNPIKRSRLEELGRLEGTEEVPKRNNCITLLFSTIITFSSEVWEGDVWEHWERIPWATSDTKLAPSQAYLIDILDGWKLQVYLTSGTMLSVPTLYKRNINCSTSTTRTKIEWTRSPTSIIYCIPMFSGHIWLPEEGDSIGCVIRVERNMGECGFDLLRQFPFIQLLVCWEGIGSLQIIVSIYYLDWRNHYDSYHAFYRNYLPSAWINSQPILSD